MSDMNNKEKNPLDLTEERELTADELAESLSRQIFSEEEAESLDQVDTDDDILTIDRELMEAFAEDDQEDDTDALMRELMEGTAEALGEKSGSEEPASEAGEDREETETEKTAEETEEETAAETESVEETEEETAAETEPSEETEEEAESAEETKEAETEAESSEETEEKPEAEAEPAEETEKEPEAEPAEEAFDEEDTGIIDVSEGISAITDAPTEELPDIPSAIAMGGTAAETAGSTTESQEHTEEKLSRKERKAEKKRLKQEAKEAEKRARLEEKERRKQEKADRKAEKKAKKKKGVLKTLLLLLGILIVAAAIVYMALSNRYKNLFFDGTVINGADCTGLTVSEAETVIGRQMDDYSLTITFRDGKKEVITGEDIDFVYVADGSVQEIKDSQVPVMWATAFFQEYSYEATAASSFDSAKLSAVLTALEESNIVNMTAPTDALVEYNEETEVFEITPETQGNTFDLSAFIEAVSDAVSHGETELNVEELGLYQEPVRTSEDEDLVRQLEEMNDVISSTITYKLPTGKEIVLNANILHNWISRDENGNLYIDSDVWGSSVATFVEDIAREVNTSDAKAEFTTINGAVVSLDNYLQGWLVDEEAEGNQLTEELAARTVTTREPIYAERAYAEDNNGIGNTYVEIDLSQQYLWVIENGSVIMETSIVSGTMEASTYTPEGIYPLYGKQEGRYLRGTQYADGSYEYVTWVDYWMPFNGGIGMHDATWRTSFGGTTYIQGGSHGCINLPWGMAAEIYSWITAGTPVICYYSAGYTLY